MSALHALFHLRDQQRFQRQLDASKAAFTASSAAKQASSLNLSSSGGRSWSKPSPLSSASGGSGAGGSLDVNARDWLGRTVLHLACAAVEPHALECVRLLLAHPGINVNLADAESHWTALHRALYAGNLPAAILLLKRADTDTSLKDLEGYTAYDLYNATLEGTKPSPLSPSSHQGAELYTWGANRNAALGLGDASDRAFPEPVPLRPATAVPATAPLAARFSPLAVRAVGMSKLHTVVVVTSSPPSSSTSSSSAAAKGDNVRACGFASTGRLGPSQPAHTTQFALQPLGPTPAFPPGADIVAVALGQDHTLALARTGEVYSWGLNRFSQLGYAIDPSPSSAAAAEERDLVQSTPKRIMGPLRREAVRGVAACKTASACWTEREVFTWGTNHGQLGYDRAAQPVQVQPRIVTKITQPVKAIAITDHAMACLLASEELICIHNDRSFKINFPAQCFPSEMTPYRPPAAIHVRKVTASNSGSGFAVLSSAGEVFTFSLPPPPPPGDPSPAELAKPRPQRAWDRRKKFSAATDVALGADGALVLCTESGHVYVRAGGGSGAGGGVGGGGGGGGKGGKRFQRVPGLQRVVAVCANETGAFGALRADARPERIAWKQRGVGVDVGRMMPFAAWGAVGDVPVGTRTRPCAAVQDEGDEEEEAKVKVIREEDGEEEEEDGNEAVERDLRMLERLCGLLREDRECREARGCGLFARPGEMGRHGANLEVRVEEGGLVFPAHALVAAARSARMAALLRAGAGEIGSQHVRVRLGATEDGGEGKPRLAFVGCGPLAVLVLWVYLYSDELLAVWDSRVSWALRGRLAELGVDPMRVRGELVGLAKVLELPALEEALGPLEKRAVRVTMGDDVRALYEATAATTAEKAGGRGLARLLAPDVVLRLADRDVRCHSLLLRARSPFFRSFFDEPAWTRERTGSGVLEVDLRHLRWRAMRFVCAYACGAEDSGAMFDVLEFVEGTDELVDFMFEVIAAATELHLDRLVLLCAGTLLPFVNLANACAVLSDATYYSVRPLVRRVQRYLALHLETLLEGQMLADLAPELVRALGAFVRAEQARRAPVTRSGALAEKARAVFGDWLEMQDVPRPIVPSARAPMKERESSPRLSPPTPYKEQKGRKQSLQPTTLPTPVRAPAVGEGDDIFAMDAEPSVPALSLEPPVLTSPPELPAASDGKPSAPRWKPITNAPRADMKSIMAEAETSSSKGKAPVAGPSPSRVPIAGGWRKVSSPATSLAVLAPEPPVSTLTWRAGVPVPARAPSALDTPRATPPSSGLAQTRPVVASGPSTPMKPGLQPRAQPSANAQGPTIKPARQPSSSNSSPSIARKASGGTGKAWTLPPVQPVATPAVPGPAPSLVAIQQAQLEQGLPQDKNKKSLKQIQEEERARQEEEDFLRWWAAEEERLRLEELQLQQEQLLLARDPVDPQKKKDGPRKGKRPTKAPKNLDVPNPVEPRSTAERAGPEQALGAPRPGRGGRGGRRHAKPRHAPETSTAQL